MRHLHILQKERHLGLEIQQLRGRSDFPFSKQEKNTRRNTIISKIARYIRVDFPEDIKTELKNGAGKKKK